jgi:pimeloyl-ACP methyl ester carboxylesterase
MADYDPFARGPHPVGVRTFELDVDERGRSVPVEVWYPATAAYAGQDLDPDTQDQYEMMVGMPPAAQEAVRDAEPLAGACTPVVFSHGFAGHRRQTTHLCTHLASHGYTVAAPDHVGNTTADVMTMMMGGMPDDLDGYIRASAGDRPRDASRTLDALLAGEFGVEARQDGAGMSGHSFGGWTTLTTTAQDDRIIATLPLAPAGGKSALTADRMGAAQPMNELVELEWGRDVPTLMIVADEDSVLPLDGMHDLLERGSSIDKMVVLVNADHFHFCDGAELVHDMMAPLMGGQTKTSAEFVPGAHAYDVTNGLGLIHFDATLRKVPEAIALAERDYTELLAERGIAVDVVTA